jgi:hypothetical protein
MTRDEANEILRAHNPLKEADPEGFPTKFQDWVIDAVLEAVNRERAASVAMLEKVAKETQDQSPLGKAFWCKAAAAAVRARSD